MTLQKPEKPLIIRWLRSKGLAAILLFLAIVTLIEYVIVLYAISLGVQDTMLLPFGVSTLFHLVPVAVVITLVASWAYLTRYTRVKSPERWQKEKSRLIVKDQDRSERKRARLIERVRSSLFRVKGIAYIWKRIEFARATIASALIVLLSFSALVLVISLLAYPQLIYRIVSGAYQSNSGLLSFVRGATGALAFLGNIVGAVGNALLFAGPGFRGFVSGLGGAIGPLVNSSNVGKYLVFQNMAAWGSALAAFLFGEYRKSRRYRNIRKG